MITLGLWGKALALRIPAHIAVAAKLRPGVSVELRLRDDGTITVCPLGRAKARAAVSADDLPAYEDVRDDDERKVAAERRW